MPWARTKPRRSIGRPRRGSAEVVDLLIRAGAQVEAKNVYGVTPLALASAQGNTPIVERLLAAGANPNAILADGEPL